MGGLCAYRALIWRPPISNSVADTTRGCRYWGWGKWGIRIATVIVEPRSLMREALVSLMESNSYHVVCSVASAADIEDGAFQEVQPKLVILGALPAERVAEAASSIRRCWQDVKIIMLFEKASSMDLQNLLASGLDACIPMSASPRTLTDALQLIVSEQVRVLMVSDSAIAEPSADLRRTMRMARSWKDDRGSRASCHRFLSACFQRSRARSFPA